MGNKAKVTNIQERSLAYVDGASIIMEDPKGVERYVYQDGTYDRKSTVDPRTPHVLIGGIATNVTVLEVAHETGPQPDIGAAAGSVAMQHASEQPALRIAS